jgi:hypothetical protein
MIMPKSTTTGLLKTIPRGKGKVSLGRFAYLARSGILTNGGITFEMIVLMDKMNDHPRAAPDAFA